MKVVYDLGNIADWVSAIGTVSAVVVALYLANRDKKPRAKVSSSYSYAFNQIDGMSPEPISITIDIVNQGTMPIYLSECTIQISKRNTDRLNFRDGHHNVKKLLNPGEFYEHTLDYQQIKPAFADRNMHNKITYAYFKDGSGKKYKTKIRIHS